MEVERKYGPDSIDFTFEQITEYTLRDFDYVDYFEESTNFLKRTAYSKGAKNADLQRLGQSLDALKIHSKNGSKSQLPKEFNNWMKAIFKQLDLKEINQMAYFANLITGQYKERII